MAAKILVILGHPRVDSFGGALANAYAEGARQSGAEVRVLKLADLAFNPVLAGGYQALPELEPDLVDAQNAISWAEHLVFVYPTWWGTVPALLKGFIDRAFLPGFAFQYRKDSIWWDRLLSGRSARLIVTMDQPPWYFRLINRAPGHQMMKRTVLEFCGVKPVRISPFGPIRGTSDAQRAKILEAVRALGNRRD